MFESNIRPLIPPAQPQGGNHVRQFPQVAVFEGLPDLVSVRGQMDAGNGGDAGDFLSAAPFDAHGGVGVQATDGVALDAEDFDGSDQSVNLQGLGEGPLVLSYNGDVYQFQSVTPQKVWNWL